MPKSKKLSFLFIILSLFGVLIYSVFLFLEKPTTQTILKSSPEEIVLFTIPKTGTHFLRPFLEYLTDLNSVSYWSPEVECSKAYLYDKNLMKLLLSLPQMIPLYWLNQPISKDCLVSILNELQNQGDFLVTHAPYSIALENTLKERNGLVFFLIRDPRDWIISVIKHPPISGVDIFGQPIGDTSFVNLSFDDKISFILTGTSAYYSAFEILTKFLPWMNSPVCCTLRFEALLGPRGGHTQQEQLIELRKITKALQLEVCDEILLTAFEDSFGTGGMFLKGKAGTWKNHFKPDHKIAFKNLLGGLLIELGYEKDNNW